MATDLRDLEADRRLVDRFREIRGSDWTTSEKDILTNIATSALDEIERLKRLIVKEANDPITNPGWYVNLGGEWFDHPYSTEADAWTAVRKSAATVEDKAATNGK